MSELTHQCYQMDNIYLYRWVDGSGWNLVTNNETLHGYTWQARCNWCGFMLPEVDVPKPLPTEHRCRGIIETIWGNKRFDPDYFTSTKYDGFCWVIDGTDRLEPAKCRVGMKCLYCGEILNAPVIVNSVEIT